MDKELEDLIAKTVEKIGPFPALESLKNEWLRYWRDHE
jgi:hypothetical protein